MPSKFWKANSSQSSLNPPDPSQVPRVESQQGYRPDDPSIHGGGGVRYYKGYEQHSEPFNFVDPSFPPNRPGAGPPINVTPLTNPPQEHSIGGLPYSQTVQGQSPRPDSAGHSDQGGKKSFKDRLGFGHSKGEEPENAGETSHRFVFGRRKSIKRKEAPVIPGAQQQGASDPSEPPSPQPSNQWQTASQHQVDYFHHQQYQQQYEQPDQEYRPDPVRPGPPSSITTSPATEQPEGYQNPSSTSPQTYYGQAPNQQVQYQAYHRPLGQDRPAGGYLQSVSAPRTSLEQPRPQGGSRPPSRQSYQSGDSANATSGRRYPLHDEPPHPGPPSREGSFPVSQQGNPAHPHPLQIQNPATQHFQSVPLQHPQQAQQQSSFPPPPPPHQQPYQPQVSQEHLPVSAGPRLQRPMEQNKYGPHHPGAPPYPIGRQVSSEPEPADPPGYSAYQSQGPGAGQPRAGQVAQQGDMGRATPPPNRTAGDMSEADVTKLINDYRDLREKYTKVKKHYWEKDEQIKGLQNTIANQRISQSRTMWDDGEYISRLTRLDGLVSQLAFGIRKNWKVLPTWLQPFVNKDAMTTGGREMTAVGKAFVSRWLVDEVFDKFFHPGLDPDVSEQLKSIQKNIRSSAPQNNKEEEEILTGRIIDWRLSTSDGLQREFASSDAVSHRRTLTELLNAKMIGDIIEHTNDLTKAILEADARMIIDLAVAILANLPQESRDVHIEYFMPGIPVNQELMKIETGIAALSEPAEGGGDKSSQGSEGGAEESNDSKPGEGNPPSRSHSTTKKGLFGFSSSGSKKSGVPSASAAAQSSTASVGTSSTSLPQSRGNDEANQRVRMCVFVALQIRGKSVLWKAPVYTV